MKRLGNIYNKIVDYNNLILAERKAGKGKGKNRLRNRVRKDVDTYLQELQERLKTQTYKNSKYTLFSLYEPKLRVTYTLPYFPDRIVHHAIMNVLEPYWDKLFIYDSYACRTNKGQHRGMLRCMGFVKKYKYCAKLDVSQFYVSIDHDILKSIIRRKVKDKKVLQLLGIIIDSACSREMNIEYLENLGTKDALIMVKKLQRYKEVYPDRKVGVPLGNYLSQWFGNIYMNELDSYIKHTLKVRNYIRYCDDFVLFGDDKALLHEQANKIEAFLKDSLHLLMSKKSVFPTTQGVDFLGYRMFPNGCILARKNTVRKIRRRIRKLKSHLVSSSFNKERARGSLASTLGYLQWGKTYNLVRSLELDDLKRATGI